MHINGSVNARNEPVLKLDVGSLSAEVLVDTGFDGGLILPSHIANQLNLTYVGLEEFNSVSGERIVAKTYSLEINWLGKRVRVPIVVSPKINQALLGSHMLRDCRLTIDYGHRTVTIVESRYL
jgi:clan AA aspartic protease